MEMTATLRKLFSAVLAAALAAALLPAAAFASVTAAATDSRGDSTPEPLAFDVVYEKDIRCGQPVSFQLHVLNGQEAQPGQRIEYKYHLDWVNIDYFDKYSMNVTSADRMPGYQASERFDFTFYANNTYTLQFAVMEKVFGSKVNEETGELEECRTPDSIRTADLRVKVPVSDPNGESMSSAINRIASECLSAECNTDYEKALWLHDWLLNNCSYDYSMIYSHAEGALLRGKATCNGYHNAYRLLLAAVGIRSDSIESHTDNHVWTAVEMDGSWYHVDVTKDDIDYDPLPGYPDERHLFFGMSDEAMGNMHGHRDFASSHSCTSLANNYFLKSGAIHEFSDPYAGLIREALAQDRVSFSIDALNASMPQPTIRDRINRIIAAQLQSQSWESNGRSVRLKVVYNDSAFSFSATYGPAGPSTVPPEAADPATPSETAKPAAEKASLSKAKVTGLVSKAYTGKRITQKPTVKLAGKTLKLNRDYTLHFANNIKRGTAIVTVKGTGAYTGSKKASFKIMKYKQPMKCSLKAKAKTLRASKVSKAPVSIPKPFTVKKAKGKVSFANVSTQKTAKAFKVNPRTGTVTVPKMTKKGTYLLKVRIQAAGSSPYAYGSRNLALKVQIR